jgi:hypothetical protein
MNMAGFGWDPSLKQFEVVYRMLCRAAIYRFICFLLKFVLVKRGVELMTALSWIRLRSYNKVIWKQAAKKWGISWPAE